MAVIETWLTQDLKKPVQVHQLCGNFFSHNGNANRIGVKVFDNGSPVTLSGTVSGYAVLPDGTTVPCTGSLSGNQASVLLPAAAYVPGNICVTIMLTSGTTITTLGALTGTVVMARTDTQVDPGSVVTDWTNTINSALQTVEGYTGNIIATPYASLTYPVPLGKYCIYNNLLYRCISPIASSESWTASHWVQVKLADDVSDLKSAIINITGEDILQFTNGKYIQTNGATVDITDIKSSASYAYAISDCQEGDVYTIWGKGGSSPRLWCFIDSSGNSLSVSLDSQTLTGATITAPANASKLVVNCLIANTHHVYKGVNINNRIDNLANELETGLQENEELIQNTQNSIGTDATSLTAEAVSAWKVYPFRLYAGCKYRITISGFTGTAWVSFFDKDGTNKLSKELTAASTFEYTFDVDIYTLHIFTASGCTVSETHTGIYELTEHFPEYAVKDDTKHIVTVGKDGTKDYTTIGAALAAITDSAIHNQYEVVIYPGVYNENYLIPPDYVHVHGIQANLVTVDSTGLDTTYSVFDLQRHVKLSNLRILSKTKYCIHIDKNENHGTIVCEGLYCERLPGGNSNTSCIGIGAWKGGALYIFKGCTFVNGPVGAHTNYDPSDTDNTHLVFDGCKFVSSRIELGLAAGIGNNICEINGIIADRNASTFMIFYNNSRVIDEPDTYYALPMNWNVIGHGNKNFVADLTNTRHGLMIQAVDYNKAISVSGSAVDALFGVTKVKGASSIIKGAVYGSLRVDDEQAGSGATAVDIFQMWKRLGDCSVTNKTLTVTVDGVAQTYTFDQDYTSSKPSEETLLAAVNAVITNAVISAYSPDCTEMINTTDKSYVKVAASTGITKGMFVRYDGYKASANSTKSLIKGIALEDGIQGEIIPVWCGNAMKYTGANGDYGIGSDGKLSADATTKIGYILSNRFYMYEY